MTGGGGVGAAVRGFGGFGGGHPGGGPMIGGRVRGPMVTVLS
jgi:hypothetical protein